MAEYSFHPAVSDWFDSTFAAPTEPQRLGWPAIQSGRHTLIAAPTGHGKTLAAFLAAIDDLVRQGLAGPLAEATQVVYISPLKALSNDIEKNLREPLAGINKLLAAGDHGAVPIRVQVRTGDTSPSERARMTRRPPHILVTTPESLYILLTSEGGRSMLGTVRTVIIDEIHALIADKRGSHLGLTLERLEALTSSPPVRIGLSATQKPIGAVARFLVGARRVAPGEPACEIVDAGHRRDLDLRVEMPRSPLDGVMAAEVWDEVYTRLADLVAEHATTLVFVNTRRLAERVTKALEVRLGPGQVTSHHGSLSKERRLRAEQRLKAGQLRALVATASLELGIDIGSIDLVCQVGSTTSIATLLQRVGRSGHRLGDLPKGRLFPLSRDQLVECAALMAAVRDGELDRIIIPEAPLDILAQQIVAAVAARPWSEDELFALVRRSHSYRNLSRHDFDGIVEMLAQGFNTERGRRGAYLHRDRVNGQVRSRRGARLTALTSGGAIPDNADYDVVLEPSGTFIGRINEDFAIESLPGDVFQLGNHAWEIGKVGSGKVHVVDAAGKQPSMPFWLGEAPSRSAELSVRVAGVRETIERFLEAVPLEVEGGGSVWPRVPGEHPARRWLTDELGLSGDAADELVAYLGAAKSVLGVLPSQQTLVLERFFDESGGMQLVLHSPFGSRLNRAWGLALRKRFCRKFNFELQAAANEDAIVLSLGPTHSFPLADVFEYLHPSSLRDVLTQALLDSPMFSTRWRWNASRALAVPRFRGGRKVPPRLQRMQADDLVAVVFPDQLACLENIAGDREVPDHPLVHQTIEDCLHEAMDLSNLEALIAAIRAGEKRLVARDLVTPSPLSEEILNAKPYAFLDDAPLEERRTRAVQSRRWLDPATVDTLGALDRAAIERVKTEAWPAARDADELHDALLVAGFVTEGEGRAQRAGGASTWLDWLAELVAGGRATRCWSPGVSEPVWVAAERLGEIRLVQPGARVEPACPTPPGVAAPPNADAALEALLESRLEVLGPVTASALAAPLNVPESVACAALVALESRGVVFRGRYTPGAGTEEWCERGLLARIHRATLQRLRREIEPVAPAVFMRFLFEWQGLTPEAMVVGPDGLAAVAGQLEGYAAAAGAWEAELLPSRVADYDPQWLDQLCGSGRLVWARLTPGGTGGAPLRTTPIELVAREHWSAWRQLVSGDPPPLSDVSVEGRAVRELLVWRGASFFDDLVVGTSLLRSQVADGLAELAAGGLVTSDSFQGLRALISGRRARQATGGAHGAPRGLEVAGRWDVLERGPAPGPAELDDRAEPAEVAARALLRRYGVVFRRLLDREALAPPWRALLRVFRRLEARGEVRGGRFVSGFAGEQFALPEAIGPLRAVRRRPPDGELVTVHASDPLNLIGIVVPGPKLPAQPGNRLVFRDGVPIAQRSAEQTKHLVALDDRLKFAAEAALRSIRAVQIQAHQ